MTTIRASEPLVAEVRGGGQPRRRAGDDGRQSQSGSPDCVASSAVDARIAQLLAEAPPLSAEQISRLRLLLCPRVPASQPQPSAVRADT